MNLASIEDTPVIPNETSVQFKFGGDTTLNLGFASGDVSEKGKSNISKKAVKKSVVSYTSKLTLVEPKPNRGLGTVRKADETVSSHSTEDSQV